MYMYLDCKASFYEVVHCMKVCDVFMMYKNNWEK